MVDVIVPDGTVKFRMQVVLRRIGKVDRGCDVDGLRPCVIGEEIIVVRKSLSQAERAGIVERETDRFHVEHEAEVGIGGPARSRRPNIGWEGGTKSCCGCVTKILLAAWQSRAVCFHVSWTVAVDAGVHGQPAGMHPLIPQRKIKVFAKLVFHFQAGLLGERLVKLLLGVAKGDLNQVVGEGISASINEIHYRLLEKRKPGKADAGGNRIVSGACAHCPRRSESDQVLAGILELRQEGLIHVTEFRSAHPAHKNIAVHERSVEQTEAAAHHTLPSIESVGKGGTWLDVVIVGRVESAYLFQLGSGR